jgi:arylsulfatase A-like enzyme
VPDLSTARRFPLARGAQPPRARNVLLILTDQQRQDSIGAYGGPGGGFWPVTPALDRLAGEGTRFERCYGTNPFCCPSRASILTGLYPRTHGLWDNGVQFDDVRATTLGDLLRPQGYRTGCVGKLHLNAWFREHPPRGYEESQDYWQKHPELRDWHGPYCGFDEVELTIGHVHYSTRGGHYSSYLEEASPEAIGLLTRERALVDHGYVETWHNAIPEPYHYNTWIADRTIAMIDRLAAPGGGAGAERAPFFVQCSFPDPHHPFSACEPYASMFSPDEMPSPLPPSDEHLAAMPPHYRRAYLGDDHEFARNRPFERDVAGAPLREMMAQMHGMVTHVDRCIGRVIAHLEARGLLEETLVVFTTDHGELLGDHGFLLKGPFFYQALLNLPLIVRCPGVAPGVRHEVVSHTDLVPTVLDCLGSEVPAYLPGFSLRGHLEGWPGHVRDAALTEYRPSGENIKVLHSPEWKYVYYHDRPHGELFHLSEDPDERHNRYADPAYAAERRRLHDRLLGELVGTESAWPPKGWWA